MRWLVLLLVLSGCVVERDTRMCADYGYRTVEKQKCVPLYGSLICGVEPVTETYCKLYFEDEEENGNN